MNATVMQPSEAAAVSAGLWDMRRELFGGRSAVTRIEPARSGGSTSFNTYIITVHFAAGGESRFFLKDFGFSRLPKDSLAERRERELRVYRDLLSAAALGTARYYGSVWDPASGRFWLLLEFVEGVPVSWCGMEYWVAAAAWLPRLHRHFADDAFGECGYLKAHNARFFRATAERARQEVSEIAKPWAGRLSRVLRRYDGLVDRLAFQPATLLHGSYRPYNILVDAKTHPHRLCPVDWEGAALGAPLFDLAYLADGFGPAETELLLAAYHQAALAEGLQVPDRAELRRDLGCFRLYMALDRVSRARAKGRSEDDVSRLIAEAEELSRAALQWAA